MFRPSLVRTSACALGLVLAALWVDPALAKRPMGEIMADAVKARDAGELDRTVVLLREAYAAQAAPEILNNMGKILEQLGRYREAVNAYQKVADDPMADAQLRSLDTTRVAVLQAKLNRAWVLPNITPHDAMIYVDGQLIELPPGVEFPTSHRKHVILVVHPDEKLAVLRYSRFLLERRTQFSLDMNQPGKDAATLIIPRERAPRDIRVNGKLLGDGIRRLQRLRMPAGRWDLEVTTAEGKRYSVELTLTAGAETPLPLDTALEEEDVVSASDGGIPNVDAGLATSSTEPSTTMPLLPWAGVAAGVASTGVGVALLLAAATKQHELDTDLNQGDGNVWTINDKPTSFSPITYREAVNRQSAINADSRNAGFVCGVGSALLVVTTTWLMMNMKDGGAEESFDGELTGQLFFAPNGVAITGRF